MNIDDAANFGNNRARDVLDQWIEQIIDSIRETFELDDKKSIYSDLGDGNIMGNIDIILTLCHHYDTSVFCVPLPEAKEWKRSYLDTYDRNIHHYNADKQYVVTRRKVIESTFDRFLEVIIDFKNE